MTEISLEQRIVDFLHTIFPGDERLPGKPSWRDENTEATAQPPGAVAPAAGAHGASAVGSPDPWAPQIAPETPKEVSETPEEASETPKEVSETDVTDGLHNTVAADHTVSSTGTVSPEEHA